MAYRKGSNGLRVIVVFCVNLLGISATNMEPIYWNTLNKRFGDSRGYVLYPQIGDRLDLICPAPGAAGPPSSHAPPEYEFYRLYLVRRREEAERCEVIDQPPNPLLTCDRPHSSTRFTIKFQELSPSLRGHEFLTHTDYYIIATSDGTRQGLDSLRGGVCVTHGMKVVLKVGQTPAGNASHPGGVGGAGSGARMLVFSNMVLIGGGVAGSAFILLAVGVACGLCYCCRRSKHEGSSSLHPLSTVSSVRARDGGERARVGDSSSLRPSDIIIPLRIPDSDPSDIIIPLQTPDTAYCPHYEKVSSDYGNPVYIVQEVPSQYPAHIHEANHYYSPQNPANVFYKV